MPDIRGNNDAGYTTGQGATNSPYRYNLLAKVGTRGRMESIIEEFETPTTGVSEGKIVAVNNAVVTDYVRSETPFKSSLLVLPGPSLFMGIEFAYGPADTNAGDEFVALLEGNDDYPHPFAYFGKPTVSYGSKYYGELALKPASPFPFSSVNAASTRTGTAASVSTVKFETPLGTYIKKPTPVVIERVKDGTSSFPFKVQLKYIAIG